MAKAAASDNNRTLLELVPAKWWQAIDFVRLNFRIMKGHDPWADRVLSRPWSPSSLLEYAYMLYTFFTSEPYFVTISGEPSGVLWTMNRSGLLYIISLGVQPGLRMRGLGIRAADLIADYGNRHEFRATAAKIAVRNRPIQRLVRAFGSEIPGLATTRLAFPSPLLPSTRRVASQQIEIRKIGKTEAARSWRHWKLQGVEHVTGPANAEIAADFMDAFDWLDPLPRGEYLALQQDGKEIGLAIARRHRQRKGELELSLLTSAELWPGPPTKALVTTLASHLGTPVSSLWVTQKQADVLADGDFVEFERDRKRERHFVFWQYPYSLKIGPRVRRQTGT